MEDPNQLNLIHLIKNSFNKVQTQSLPATYTLLKTKKRLSDENGLQKRLPLPLSAAEDIHHPNTVETIDFTIHHQKLKHLL